MISIALLIPVCSRNQTYKTFEDTPFAKYLFPSFLKTMSPNFHYTLYIGIDHSDKIYKDWAFNFFNFKQKNIYIQCVFLKDCEHKPAHAWNELFDLALRDGHHYFYQIGDDVEMLTPWADRFVDILLDRGNRGVVGGCHDYNYNGRIQRGKEPVIENAFVHRTHYDLFHTFFNREIENWYCDDWITEIYKPDYATLCTDIKVNNKVMDRYNIKDIGEKIKKLIKKDKKSIY